MSNPVIIEEIDRNLIVRFNRPEMRSPLSIVVLNTLSEIVDSVASRSDIDRLIFTGSRGVFASGADLREIANVSSESAREFAVRGQDLMVRISKLNARSIAAVNGICFGGALDLALACDVRLASPDALFAHPGADLGIITGWGGTQRLPGLIGEARALEMFFTAKRVDAREALEINLVSAIGPEPLEAALLC